MRGQGYGTHFFVMPTSKSLEDDIDEEEMDVATPLKKNLLGFSNTMIPNEEEPPIKALFRDHLLDGRVNELIARESFLTPNEFISADHHFDGAFDAYGQFKGTLQLYGEPPIEYTLPWEKADGSETECGPFRVRIAYVQGNPDETRMPPDQWSELTQKLNLIGGLYIYRDGIRILPYGNLDFDFLHIERRRTKKAQDWFFSYRRMFGAVEISYRNNPSLHEKAGREGFRSNTAYRQFRDILECFVKRLAIDFFRPTSDRGDEFRKIKAELQERGRLLKKKEELAKEKKKAFTKKLEVFFDEVEEGLPAKQADKIHNNYFARLEGIRKLNNPEDAGKAILKLEREFDKDLTKLRKQFTLARPRGLGMNKKLTADWHAYQKNSARLEETIYAPLRAEIEEKIEELVSTNQAAIDRNERIVGLFDEAANRHRNEAKRLRSKAKDSKADLGNVIEKTTQASFHNLLEGLGNLEAEMRSVNFSEMSEEGFERYRSGMLGRLDDLAVPEKLKLDRLRDQLDAVTEAIREGESIVEMADAAEDETLALREELSSYTEFAQTGMALGIIQHEFSSTVKAVRESIRKIKPWAAGTPALAEVHKDLRGSFDHLDGYLKLFTPLSRRLYRSKVELSGEEIRRYLMEIFGERLTRHEIQLKASTSFDRFTVEGFPSTFLPVFINLVDNAIYWIGFDRESEPWIKLDADTTGFLVSNGGPGIETKDSDRIFEFGESNKIGGRGMGLFISRQALTNEGWDITLESVGRNIAPMFRIGPLEQAKDS